MEYSKIIAVSGLPGLYELISSKNDGAIIRSLDDNTTRFAASRVHNFSHLESIEVYTTGENVNLVDVFNAIEKEGGSLPDSKDNAAVKKYFEKVYPDLDFEKVYGSDLKKMVKWFDVLKKNEVEIKLSEHPAEEEEQEVAEVKEELVVVADGPAKQKAKAAAPVEKAKEIKETKISKEAKEEPKKKAATPKIRKEEAPKEKVKAARPKSETAKSETSKTAKPKEEKADKTVKKKKS